jgi:DNA replication and repair protein RecF
VRLTRLEVDRLRNLKEVRLDLEPGLTMVAGRNGQGKTSLLEAVYMLGTGRSFRTRRNDDLVSWHGGGPLRVSGVVEHVRGTTELAVQVEGATRGLLWNGLERELEDYLGHLDLVDLTAPRMNVLRGAPDERRRFLDRGVVSLQPHFLSSLGEYRRVLGQRNALLRTGRASNDELSAWDERLRIASKTLHIERRRLVEALAELLPRCAHAVFPEGKAVVATYTPSPRTTIEVDAEGFDQAMDEALAGARSRDLNMGHSTVGPHRDELKVELDGVDLRRFGSAGQVRGAMVALKLAKLCLLHEKRQEAPLFLMDDFDTDLDDLRMQALADFLHEGGFQALVATSKEAQVARLEGVFRKLRMDDGVVRTE